MTAFDYGHRIKPETKTSDIAPGTAVAAFSHRTSDGCSTAYTAFIISDGKNRNIKVVTEGPVSRTAVRISVRPGTTMITALSDVIAELNSSMAS